jgi:hypothetical protein
MRNQIHLQQVEQDEQRLEPLRREIVRRAEPEASGKRSEGPAPASTTWTTRFGASGKPPAP